MTNYISGTRIKQAIDSLRGTKAYSRLTEFLIFKRATSLSGSSSLPLSSVEPSLIQSINEYLNCEPSVGYLANAKADELLNPLDDSQSTNGYRTRKYYTNGMSDTLRGGGFAGIVTLSGANPAIATLTPSYSAGLAGKLLNNKSLPLPRIDDMAFWFYRFKDIDSLIASASTPEDAAKAIVDQYIKDNSLSVNELKLFVGIDPSDYPDLSWITPVMADPKTYLPLRGAGRASTVVPAGAVTASTSTASPASASAVTGSTPASGCSFNLVVALAARGFVILSGPSGTGKSRGGLQLAHALKTQLNDQELLAFVPVGADWTDTRHILGYRNPFGPLRQAGTVETHETYQLEEPLRLLLRAAHPKRGHIPHLLLLDEMNLSHVERYFSPFLSLIESGRTEEGQGLPLISSDNIALISDVLEHTEPSSSEAEAAQHLKIAGRGLTLPPNVFIIGTINVDETTYMFSPKVLDRAQVIEILSVQPQVYLDPNHTETELTLSSAAALAVLRPLAPTSVKTRPNQVFLTRAQELGFPDEWASDVAKTAEYVLQKAYEVLERVGFAFGYRLVNEVFAYLEAWMLAQKERCDETGQVLSTDGWHDALDKVFSQKVLPKIHGNRRQLNDSLTQLEAFLRGLSAQGTPNLGIPDPMPVSRKKLERMNRRLNATGYTTFVE